MALASSSCTRRCFDDEVRTSVQGIDDLWQSRVDRKNGFAPQIFHRITPLQWTQRCPPVVDNTIILLPLPNRQEHSASRYPLPRIHLS